MHLQLWLRLLRAPLQETMSVAALNRWARTTPGCLPLRSSRLAPTSSPPTPLPASLLSPFALPPFTAPLLRSLYPYPPRHLLELYALKASADEAADAAGAPRQGLHDVIYKYYLAQVGACEGDQ